MKIVIPCGGKKRETECAARDMYKGGYFKQCLNYALSLTQDENIYILSAKYGFLKLNDTIKPYNVRFGDKGEIQQQAINASAQKHGLNGPVLVIGGKDYVDRAIKAMPSSVSLFKLIGASLRGKGIGYQMEWLKNNHGKNPLNKNHGAVNAE